MSEGLIEADEITYAGLVMSFRRRGFSLEAGSVVLADYGLALTPDFAVWYNLHTKRPQRIQGE